MGFGKSSNTVSGSTNVVEQLSFSLFLSILTFDFHLILGSYLTFCGHNGQFLGLGKGSYTVLWSTHEVEQLSLFYYLKFRHLILT